MTARKLLLLWLRHVFSKSLRNIIIGNVNRLHGKERWLYYYRHRICLECLHRETLPVVGEVCGICGCPLKSKLRAEDEKCDLNKWK